MAKQAAAATQRRNRNDATAINVAASNKKHAAAKASLAHHGLLIQHLAEEHALLRDRVTTLQKTVAVLADALADATRVE